MRLRALRAAFIHSLLPARKPESHKGDFGHVLIVAGSRGMAGACALSAAGALRSGAGLVTAAIVSSQVNTLARCMRPEAMILSLPETMAGTITTAAFSRINDYLVKRRITALVVGPGLRDTRAAYQVVRRILALHDIPVVLDADALNLVARYSVRSAGLLSDLVQARAQIIITPHPAEFARLTGSPLHDIRRHPEDLLQRFAAQHRVVGVLKGHTTLISDGTSMYRNTNGNPGMASGGSGDVLSGMIAAWIAQVPHHALLAAAACGVYLHGLAGDLAAAEKTEVGMLAGDIAEHIPAALKEIRIK